LAGMILHREQEIVKGLRDWRGKKSPAARKTFRPAGRRNKGRKKGKINANLTRKKYKGKGNGLLERGIREPSKGCKNQFRRRIKEKNG